LGAAAGETGDSTPRTATGELVEGAEGLQNAAGRFYIVFSRQTLFFPLKQCLRRSQSVLGVSNIVLPAKTLFHGFKHCFFPKNNV
jgi:hypothetical protein